MRVVAAVRVGFKSVFWNKKLSQEVETAQRKSQNIVPTD